LCLQSVCMGDAEARGKDAGAGFVLELFPIGVKW
jgi:hypothetical protein